MRGISAVGSAQHWQCWGQGFESPMLHQSGIIRTRQMLSGSYCFFRGIILGFEFPDKVYQQSGKIRAKFLRSDFLFVERTPFSWSGLLKSATHVVEKGLFWGSFIRKSPSPEGEMFSQFLPFVVASVAQGKAEVNG